MLWTPDNSILLNSKEICLWTQKNRAPIIEKFLACASFFNSSVGTNILYLAMKDNQPFLNELVRLLQVDADDVGRGTGPVRLEENSVGLYSDTANTSATTVSDKTVIESIKMFLSEHYSKKDAK